MKKIAASVVLIIMFFCASNSFAEVSVAEAKEAFITTFEVFRNTNIVHRFGFLPAGVEMKDGSMYFKDADLYFFSLEFQGKYKTISGEIVKKSEQKYEAKISLSGGAVTTIAWTMTNYDQAKKVYTAAVEADGTKLNCTVEETLSLLQK